LDLLEEVLFEAVGSFLLGAPFDIPENNQCRNIANNF